MRGGEGGSPHRAAGRGGSQHWRADKGGSLVLANTGWQAKGAVSMRTKEQTGGQPTPRGAQAERPASRLRGRQRRQPTLEGRGTGGSQHSTGASRGSSLHDCSIEEAGKEGSQH